MNLDWELCKKIVETADNLLYENEEFKSKYNSEKEYYEKVASEVQYSPLNTLSSQIHDNAVKHGFYDKPKEIGTLLMLVVSELGEAINADRAGRHCSIRLLPDNIHKQQFEDAVKDTFEDEIADAIIRLLDLCGYLSIDIDKHIAEKMRYNANREKLHGKQY